MGMPGGFELFAIVAVVVLLFGGKKIPELASGIGKGIKNFKAAVKEDDEPAVTATATTTEAISSESKEEAPQTTPKTTA